MKTFIGDFAEARAQKHHITKSELKTAAEELYARRTDSVVTGLRLLAMTAGSILVGMTTLAFFGPLPAVGAIGAVIGAVGVPMPVRGLLTLNNTGHDKLERDAAVVSMALTLRKEEKEAKEDAEYENTRSRADVSPGYKPILPGYTLASPGHTGGPFKFWFS